jgi:hypothetical protein
MSKKRPKSKIAKAIKSMTLYIQMDRITNNLSKNQACEHFGELVGYSPKYIMKLLSGSAPMTEKTAAKILKALDDNKKVKRIRPRVYAKDKEEQDFLIRARSWRRAKLNKN